SVGGVGEQVKKYLILHGEKPRSSRGSSPPRPPNRRSESRREMDKNDKNDAKSLEERHDAMVRRILAAEGPCLLIVLGASHDLSDSVRKLGKGEVEYVRMTTKTVKEFVSP